MNLLAFPFYDNINKQSRFIRDCFNAPAGLVAPNNKLLPFMFRKAKTGLVLSDIEVISAVTNRTVFGLGEQDFPYKIYRDATNDIVFHYGAVIPGMNLECGEYYLQISNHVSEVFKVVNDIERYTKFQWKHVGGRVENIIYQTGFVNTAYLDIAITEPVFKVEAEGSENGNASFVATRSKMAKTYNFDTEYLPEFLIEALAGIYLHNNVVIGPYNDVKEFKIDTKGNWNKNGCTAIVSAEFTAGNPASSDCCSGNFDIEEVDLIWQNTDEPKRCEKINGVNTGYLERQQFNSVTSTFRWVRDEQNISSCPVPATIYRSAEISGLVYRNDCGQFLVPTGVTYTVPEGQITDTTNQDDVDERALIYFINTSQGYAVANDTCIVASGANRFCEFDGNGCFTGRMTDNLGNVFNPSTAECVRCNADQDQNTSGNTFCFNTACE